MEKPLFPTDIFIGLVFNDFIANTPSLAHAYVSHALQVITLDNNDALVMDEDVCEVIYIERLHETPRWILYNVTRKNTIKKLNTFIFKNLICILKKSKSCIFKHPAGIYVYVGIGSDDVYTYLLIRTNS